jgi:arylsulfatase A-like enzyme
MTASPPNVLVIVMDCVRADEFRLATSSKSRMQFLRSLRAEVIDFENAMSTAPWTLPAHASLFTGLYPWEHSAHNRGEVRLPGSVPRISSILASEGYACGSFSANGFLSPPFGLTEGFQVAEWGEWWELYWRFVRRARGTASLQESRTGPLWSRPSFREYVHALNRTPRILDVVNRVGQKFRPGSPQASGTEVANWIESSIHHWLAGLPRSRPAFCFVNLLEAHEPYLTETTRSIPFGEWWRATRGRMDRSSAIMGDWHPTSGELERLRAFYREGLNTLDVRIASIVREFKESDRWDSTLLVLTSDHGQSFGENQMLFHGLRVDDLLLRVPLWMRLPDRVSGGSVRSERVSLIDVAPTIYRVAGVPPPPGMSGISLLDPIHVPDTRAIFAIADGIHSEESRLARWASESSNSVDTEWAAVYRGNWKVTVNPSRGIATATDLNSGVSTSDWNGHAELLSLREEAVGVARLLRRDPAKRASREVEERLRSWGYD